jgi:hypothetical protein
MGENVAAGFSLRLQRSRLHGIIDFDTEAEAFDIRNYFM